MSSVVRPSSASQAIRQLVVLRGAAWLAALGVIGWGPVNLARAEKPVETPAELKIPEAEAASEKEMKPYTEQIRYSDVTFEMLPIPGGTFRQGSPDDEADREEDEGPVHEVQIKPFWMGKCEVTWDEYEVFMFTLDVQRRGLEKIQADAVEQRADACAKPTKPYTDMTFGMGREGFPAICMTQYAARMYCDWLSAKTGRYYRLPTEAEWEYACRAGTDTAYSFGDDPEDLEDYAWYFDNADDAYHPVGEKKPNPWGLHDMHGNVAEWCADQYDPTFYAQFAGKPADNPFLMPKTVEPGVVRGGSWDDDPDRLRSASRVASTNDWKQQDPQIPQSIWYYTDALFLGFRVVRPLEPPTPEVRAQFSASPEE